MTEYKLSTYKDLIVWQKSMDLVVEIYKLTNSLPKHELYTLTSQIRRASISIPSNITEGKRRGTKNEFLRYLIISFASASEVETQILIAKRLNYISENESRAADLLLNEILKMLNKMIFNLRSSTP